MVAVWHTFTIPHLVELYYRATARDVLSEGLHLHKGQEVSVGFPVTVAYGNEEHMAVPLLGRPGPAALILLDELKLTWLTKEAEDRLMAD